MILSIEFGSNIKIVEGYKKKNILMVSKAVTLDVSADIYHAGFINIDFTAEAINDALTENKISTKKAVFIVDSESVIIRKIKLPLLKKKSETLSMIVNELEQLISADLNQYKVIYKVIDTYDDDGFIKALYAVYCLPLNIYMQYKKLAETLKLKLIKLDISSNCLNSISEHDLKINNRCFDKDDVLAFVGIDFQKITFCAVNKGINDFFIVRRLDNSIESAAESQAPYMNSYGASEKMHMPLFEEINKCIRYYHSVYNSRINKIYIFGYFSSLWSFDKLLSLNLNIEVEIIKSLSNIVFKEKSLINEYFISVVALYDFKSINFLYNNKDNNIVRLRNIAIAAAVFFCFLFFFFRHTASFQREIKVISIYVNDEDNIKHSLRIEKLKEENVLLESRINQIEGAINSINNEYVHSDILREIYYSIPENTKVLSFSADKSSINMQCESLSIDEVILLLSSLKNIDFVEEIDTPAIQTLQNSKYSYSVVCKFKDVKLIEE